LDMVAATNRTPVVQPVTQLLILTELRRIFDESVPTVMNV